MDYVENDLGVQMGLTPYRHCFELTEGEVRKLMSKVLPQHRQGDGREMIPQEELHDWLAANTSGKYLVTSGLSRINLREDDEDSSGIWVQFADEKDAFHFRMRF